MTKKGWENKIKKATISVGTYKSDFDAVISTLASILEKRDKTEEIFASSGGETVIEYTNKFGATNIVKNPILVVLMDLNSQALSYWRDLGLTPAGLKKINESAMKKQKKSALAEALSSLE